MLPDLTFRFGRRAAGRFGAILLATGLLGTNSANAAAPGLTVQTATARSSAVTSSRIALLLVPQPISAGSRAAIAHADEEVYRKRLRDLGFDVWTLGPADRPQAERSVREAVARLPEDAQIAVFALGPTLGADEDVFLLPQGAPGDLAQRPALVESEGIRLGDLLRRIALRRPRDLVAVIDECQPARAGRCDFDMVAGRSGASVIGSERVGRRGAGGAPLAGRSSLREPMLVAMSREGDSFLQSHAVLAQGLNDSDLEPRASGTLSTSFSFIPPNFFGGLRTECSAIDVNADPTSLKSMSLDGPVRACEAMLAAYPYARPFEARLQAGREQRAFQRAVASCDDGLTTGAYGTTYPAGRFRSIVDGFALDCSRARERLLQDEQRRRDEIDARRRQEVERQETERRRQETERQDAERRRQEAERQDGERRRLEAERQEAERRREADRQDELRRQADQRTTIRSAAGWGLTYASNLLEVRPLGNDAYDAQKQSYSTIWQSRQHGEQVLVYVQVSPNERCGDARQYVSEQIQPRRARVTRTQDVTTSPVRTSYIIEGQGTARGQGLFDDRSFLEFVSIRRDDKSTITHIGGRFPSEYTDVYRAELLKMMNSMTLPPSDIFTRRCG